MRTLRVWVPFFVLWILLQDQQTRGVQVPKYLQNKYGTKTLTSERHTDGSASKFYTKTKSASKTKINRSSWSAPLTEQKRFDPFGDTIKKMVSFQGGCTSMPKPSNAVVRCSQFSGCKADCKPNHQFPNGKTQLKFTCHHEEWITPEFQGVPDCEAICDPPCLNNGICSSDNQCHCPENFSGPQCEIHNIPCLSTDAPLPKNARRVCSSKQCTFTCLPNKAFPDGSQSTSITCKDGKWVSKDNKLATIPNCKAVCSPPCQNNATCLSNNQCRCLENFSGSRCEIEIKPCLSANAPLPRNTKRSCSNNKCSIRCFEDHEFPDGSQEIYIECQNGNWVSHANKWETIPDCRPICILSCQNNGICWKPNECNCPENFSGPQCQYENKPCLNHSPMPKNAKRSCNSKQCTVTCMTGHQFPDGSAIATMTCKDGLWVPTRDKWVTIPDCQATCDPPCLNGGNCLSYNVCQCPQDYRGSQCQYLASVCSPKLLDFNGGYNCSGNADTFSCSVSCPTGIDFEFPPAPVYTCSYSLGFFLPAPIPDCVYPDGSQVDMIPGSDESQLVSNEFDLSSEKTRNLIKRIQKALDSGESLITTIKRIRKELSSSKGGMSSAEKELLDQLEEALATGQEDIINDIKTMNVSDIPVTTPKSIMVDDSSKIISSKVKDLETAIIEQKLPTPGTCFTWGGSHYKTFDNRVFSFKSPCPHVLVRDSKDSTFSIIIQDAPTCTKDPLNCYEDILIYIQNVEYLLTKSADGQLVFKSGEKVLPIPGRIPGIRVELQGNNLLLNLDTLGVSVLWDGQQLIQVSLKENHWNRTEGLCGNLDGDPSTDVVSEDGQTPKNILTFANSWKVDHIGNRCEDSPSEDQVCTKTPEKTQAATDFCQKIISDNRFKQCQGVLDIGYLYDACRSDYCNCPKEDPTSCACETFNVYVKHCSHFGIKQLFNWRDEKTCPMNCTNGKIYKSCSSTDRQPTCGAIAEGKIDTKDVCVEGCFCPEGTVLNDGKCITRDQCPCKLRGKSFTAGSSVPKDCNTCTCVDGQWVCTQVDCGARCSSIGDPHYFTFDGKKYDFMGKCSYYLVKTNNFSIEAENTPCAGAISEAMNFPVSILSGTPSCTKTVTVRINGQIIKLKQNNELIVNGEDVHKVPFTIAGIKIRKVSSIFLQTTLPNGVEIWWDGNNRVYIDLPAKFSERTRGLCGTFNYNQKDDFLTPQDDIEQSVIAFANKWKTTETCPDLPEVVLTHPCDRNIHRRGEAEQYCMKIKSELFKDCHWFVDPEQFYRDCLYDMCSCEFPVSKCLCPIMASYASECSRQGIKVDWRSEVRECGVHCPGGQSFQVCGNSCTRTCRDIAEDENCKPQCVEGCNCPEGQTLDDNGECIAIRQCQCQYRGTDFPPGYMEIRPAPKAPELCTCIDAVWDCYEADEAEIKMYPSSDLVQNKCNGSLNMEFTTCEPVEPVTCKNMHSPPEYSPAICHSGCQCKKGYVLETTTQHCVKPTECPCHHASKSYKEGSVVQSGCNTCSCKNGKWSCTDRQCAAECSAWGDSHYKTFDGKRFDYQGECDYVFAKGKLESNSFHVSVQNVPCGTLGTACFKSVTIKVTSGDGSDIITLEKDKPLPGLKSFKHITAREKSMFVIIEAPDLGLVIHWDKGTRVYVRLDPRWKGRTKGLCGNFNDDEIDDFQTPSGGLAEVSANIFGDSWRLQSYCSEAPEIKDTCTYRPDRKVWATKKCGVLKTQTFAACHSEVPVDYFFEKCIFDSCACDQGGDCECMCTALAAYAQECNSRGVAIKWRTPEFCPMQCDERCTNYNPCISTCPEETCDNLLTNKKYSKTCAEDSCIEGCAPKPCPPGYVYRNSSHNECVPVEICRPICLVVNGTTYYEGDKMEEDDCHTCYCSREEKKCSGKPCTSTTIPTTLTTFAMEQEMQCDEGWTAWINQVTATDKEQIKQEEIEPIPTTAVLNQLKDSAKCNVDMMVDIECRTVKDHIPSKETGLDVECSLEKGLICKSSGKNKECPDFEIRVKCQCEATTTPVQEQITTGEPACFLNDTREDIRDCSTYYVCTFGVRGNKWVKMTCANDTLFNPIKKTCDSQREVEKVKPSCISEIEYTFEEPIPTCAPGTVYDNCAIKCKQLCHYYSFLVKKQGLCKGETTCEAGCVSAIRDKHCPAGSAWLNENTCVKTSSCLCVTEEGKPMKPGEVIEYEEACKKCQCINNVIACQENTCTTLEETESTKMEPTTSLTQKSSSSASAPIEIIEEEEIPSTKKAATTSYTSKKVSSGAAPVEISEEEAPSTKGLKYTTHARKKPTSQAAPIEITEEEETPSTKKVAITSYTSKKASSGAAPVEMSEEETPSTKELKYTTHAKKKPTSLSAPAEITEEEISIHTTTTTEATTTTKMLKVTERIVVETEAPVAAGKPLVSETTPYPTPSVTPPEKCTKDRFIPLIQGDSPLPDDAFSASSVLEDIFSPSNARLDSDVSETSGGSWAPKYPNENQYLEINFGKQEPVYGVIVRGSPMYDEYVTSYRVLYSPDGHTFYYILDKNTKEPVIFRGSTDSTTGVKQYFDEPVEATKIRINPKSWNNGISLRIELVGCAETTPAPTTVESTSIIIVTTTPAPERCNDPLGLDNSSLSLSQISVSSSKDSRHDKSNLKLSSDSAWQPLLDSPTESVMFNFLEPRELTGVETKGGPDGWVESYVVEYSHDGTNWNPVLYEGKERIFPGNYDSDMPQLNTFQLPIRAQYLKILPKKWKNNIQLRVEVRGCYLPYPTESTIESTVPTTTIIYECNYCPGIPEKNVNLEVCRCLSTQYWDGQQCVPRSDCPCVVGTMRYSIGAIYEKEDCSECICKLGGVEHCTPKKCEPCAEGLRSTVTTTCACNCQPCEEGTILCPTSNICINSTLWCNGEEDCPDDEIYCAEYDREETWTTPREELESLLELEPEPEFTTKKPLTTTIRLTTESTTTVTQQPTTPKEEVCHVIVCPPGFEKVLKKQSKKSQNKYLSPMIRNTNTKTSGRKGGRNISQKPKTSTRKWNLPPPKKMDKPEKVCETYICVPKFPEDLEDSSEERLLFKCPEIECEDGLIPIIDNSNSFCREFHCEAPPKPDALCKVNGKTFNTFDNVEFTYDICNHVLVRDLEYDNWEISLKKTCTTVCSRDLIIQQDWEEFIIHPDFTIDFDGYTYTLDQAILLAQTQSDFIIKQIGNTILFASPKYGYWVIYNREGDVKIGVDQELIDKVDGLCGYFDGDNEGEKRKPDGSLAKTTADFGDSWALSHDQPDICHAKACPLELQNRAWTLCNKVKQKSLFKCGYILDVESFLSHCLESTCSCLERSVNDPKGEEICKCDALQNFVADCLSSEPSLDLSNWRIEQNCPAHCEAPLIYQDCYQRRCEPSCETLSDPRACPKVDDMCFPGCYCPPGYVRDGDNCVQPSSCRNCECDLKPHLTYTTYDDNQFTVNGNCVYIMSRDVSATLDNKHEFQLLITNAPCSKTNTNNTIQKSENCIGKITILYKGHKIHVLRDQSKSKLKLIVDGESIVDMVEIAPIINVEKEGNDLKIVLPDVQVEVFVVYPSLAVSIKVPSYTYAGKLEGICGDCNGNTRDDYRTPDGKKPVDEKDFGLSWLYEDLPGGQNREQCAPEEVREEKCQILPGQRDPCSQLLDGNKFGQCANLLDPTPYFEWCRKDTCEGDPTDSCEVLEQYAKECAKIGFCVSWRNNLCPAPSCPAGLFFSPCGPVQPETCESIKQSSELENNKKSFVEGCFCPKGKVLLNNTCLTPKECITCDNEGHHPGDEWNKDKCTKCRCEDTNLKCDTQQCPDLANLCERGYHAVKVPSNSDDCCEKYTCAPQPTFAPVCEPPQALVCGTDQITKLETKANGCQSYICECKPKEECDDVDLTTPAVLEPGYVRVIDTNSSCCPIINLLCQKERCPDPVPCPEFYSLKVNQEKDKCCPTYSCEAPKQCIVTTEYAAAVDGGERPLSDLEKQKSLKNVDEIWQDGPCRECTCIYNKGNDAYISSCEKMVCPLMEQSSDFEDYELVAVNHYQECCPTYTRVACKYDGKIQKIGESRVKDDDVCTTLMCTNSTSGYAQKQTSIKHCTKKCDVGFEYVEPTPESKKCCGSCKPIACVVDGKIYEIGQEWTSEDYCTSNVCTDVEGSVQVKSIITSCPEIPEETYKNFVVEIKPVEGECCEKQILKSCKINNNVVEIGETWQSPTDKCKTFTCYDKGNNELVIKETMHTCKTDCEKGWEYQESETECCGKCIQASCVLEGEVKEEGETWKSPDNCTTFSCEKIGDQFSIVTNQETCPPIDPSCDPKYIISNGCCQFCNVTTESQVKCLAVEKPEKQTVGILKESDCTNKHPIKNFTECVGSCGSETTFNSISGSMQTKCSCCQGIEHKTILVELECSDGNKLEKKILVPSKCSCSLQECVGNVKNIELPSVPDKSLLKRVRRWFN
ncbi:hemocytin [Diorhabda sublineata]|uniref:hemocytin n=1 Tax=Diorhabda sublineata TaxID=1163346 RepID=UPI0024E0DB79|nr:hemocytin [Diorhabda sublineata]